MTPEQLIDRAALWKRANAGEGVLEYESSPGNWVAAADQGPLSCHGLMDTRFPLRLALPPPPAPAPLPCPFCGVGGVPDTSTIGWVFTHEDGCYYTQRIIVLHRDVPAWNRRAPCPECARLTAEHQAYEALLRTNTAPS